MTDPRTLLERHSPRLVYDAQEPYFADSAAVWTDSPTNVLRRADGTVLAKPPKLSLAFLGPAKYADGTAEKAGDVIGETTRSYAKNAAKLHAQPAYRDRVYGHARKDRKGQLWLQYWLFYYYNDFQLLGSLLSGGKHEGDWELVQLRLDAKRAPRPGRLHPAPGGREPAVDAGAPNTAPARSSTSRAARTRTTSARARTGPALVRPRRRQGPAHRSQARNGR